jgi:uncharacterized membrane protein YkvA (DUF1232 family)
MRREACAIRLAARDPRTPRLAKALAILAAGYALSPLDLIPDFIPVLGHLDDAVLVPLGLYLAFKMIPPEEMAGHRTTAARWARRRDWRRNGSGV